MYGMVNNAVEELVVRNFGRERWLAIRARAEVDVEVFITNEPYDDAITYALVGAASAELGLTPDEVLVTFGEFWVLETATRSYGAMLEGAGRSLPEFLENLGQLHTRVQLMMPRLRPPEFTITDVTATTLTLHYHTHRAGLTSFVRGLVQGLGKRFGTPTTVEVVARKDEGADHDIFHVRWEAARE